MAGGSAGDQPAAAARLGGHQRRHLLINMLLVRFTEKVEVGWASAEGSQDLLAGDGAACVSQNAVVFRWDPSAVSQSPGLWWRQHHQAGAGVPARLLCVRDDLPRHLRWRRFLFPTLEEPPLHLTSSLGSAEQ